MNKVVFWVVLALMAVVTGYCIYDTLQTRKELERKDANFNRKADIPITANLQEIDSLKRRCHVLDSAAEYYKSQYKKRADSSAAIVNVYKDRYNEILNTVDSLQLAITLRLLAAYKAHPLKGY